MRTRNHGHGSPKLATKSKLAPKKPQRAARQNFPAEHDLKLAKLGGKTAELATLLKVFQQYYCKSSKQWSLSIKARSHQHCFWLFGLTNCWCGWSFMLVKFVAVSGPFTLRPRQWFIALCPAARQLAVLVSEID